ncbi:tripartite tricarboxylate transporter TctB family protein [Bradyrhizobium sp. dw_78]|uniref:tripartite tricarboxylate transporter TctB family protein n=1 Tax=Bradyrhizobium sp. dw_78 TaxID=2719793 RepID=UPI001BD68263|nr:tripartite tricarboxylate transporter TctB family protein [Bradyrhizobium sp. dw_78]
MTDDVYHPKADYIGGVLMTATGVFVVLQSMGYDVGSLTRMGPGFYPALVGALLALTGVGIVLRPKRPAVERDADAEPSRPEWRGWFCILAGIAAFIVAAKYAGMLPATFLIVFISAFGDRMNTIKSAAVLALVISVVSTVVFWWALGVQLPLLRWGA